MVLNVPFPRAEMPPTPTAPSGYLPPGACDTHVHMVGGPGDFQLWEGRIEDPAEGSFEVWLKRLEAHLQVLGLERVVIVHSILYGSDNAITIETVRRLGPQRAKGIGLVTDDVTETELDALVEAGICGVRLNYVHGGILSWDGVKRMAPRLAARGMHVQMLMNTHKHAAKLVDDVRALPVPVVFDHLGWPDIEAGIREPGFKHLRRLIGEGHAYVKLSGVYRLTHAPYDAVAEYLATLCETNPERCLWGSDWPHLMLADAHMPNAGQLLNLFVEAVKSGAMRQEILVEGPRRLYGFQT